MSDFVPSAFTDFKSARKQQCMSNPMQNSCPVDLLRNGTSDKMMDSPPTVSSTFKRPGKLHNTCNTMLHSPVFHSAGGSTFDSIRDSPSVIEMLDSPPVVDSKGSKSTMMLRSPPCVDSPSVAAMLEWPPVVGSIGCTSNAMIDSPLDAPFTCKMGITSKKKSDAMMDHPSVASAAAVSHSAHKRSFIDDDTQLTPPPSNCTNF